MKHLEQLKSQRWSPEKRGSQRPVGIGEDGLRVVDSNGQIVNVNMILKSDGSRLNVSEAENVTNKEDVARQSQTSMGGFMSMDQQR